MKNLFSWIIGIGGFLLAGFIMNGPVDKSLNASEGIGRWIAGIIIVTVTGIVLWQIHKPVKK